MAPLPLDTPADWIIHGDKKLICIPANWGAVLVFCLTNYLAHCATVKAHPGETVGEYSMAMILALVLPSSGITRAMDSIIRRSNLRKMNELGRATKAGALCMVIRDETWTPRVGDVLPYIVQPSLFPNPQSVPAEIIPTEANDSRDVDPLIERPVSMEVLPKQETRISKTSVISSGPKAFRVGIAGEMQELIRTSQPTQGIIKRGCKVHGLYQLPDGYNITYVPSYASVGTVKRRRRRDGQQESDEVPQGKLGQSSVEIASSYSFVKAAVGIVQTVYACITLYKARGDQIETYGYAAFGLTVVPYVLMSVLNLLGQIACAEYSTLFLVHSDVMDEARRRGGVFDGVVGTLKVLDNKRTANWELPGPWVVRKSLVGQDSSQNSCKHYILQAESDSKGGEVEEIDIISVRDVKYGAKIFIPSCSPVRALPNIPIPSISGRIEDRHARTSDFLDEYAPLTFGAISLLIVGLMTRFRKGTDSTELQRGFTMSWLVVGMVFGFLTRSMSKLLLGVKGIWSAIKRVIGFVLLYGVLLVPALGGITVVCEMIKSYGTCTKID
ncbi:hypothetical protein K505DRAFT_374704 [Melanomma pulvis-pyrius CBS 109.77]|uniref:Uncharacterized protein n=1 Tax=Melanomma pulvis-pyrius CBS 109.77 TaxID=1314802 RepID=A0A6A6XE83_9PLEO|nr:hypothetical protein K505DRAFT_374704 [Melanomma pulvis-pyrius CBS 109.77]